MRLILWIVTASMVLAGPVAKAATSPDTLTDAALLDYAAKLFKGDPSASPPRYEKTTLSVGVHHGVEVEASGVPCINCFGGTVVLYYRAPADSAGCREADGRAMLYVFKPSGLASERRQRVLRYCVPDLLVRNGLVGDGKPDDDRQGVENGY